jgi:hypothetical protein
MSVGTNAKSSGEVAAQWPFPGETGGAKDAKTLSGQITERIDKATDVGTPYTSFDTPLARGRPPCLGNRLPARRTAPTRWRRIPLAEHHPPRPCPALRLLPRPCPARRGS